MRWHPLNGRCLVIMLLGHFYFTSCEFLICVCGFFFFLFCLFLLGNLYLSYQFVRTLNINNINLLPYMWQVSLFWHFKIKARKFYFFFLCDLHLLYFAFCKPVRLSFVIDVPLCFEEFLLQLAKPAWWSLGNCKVYSSTLEMESNRRLLCKQKTQRHVTE